VSNLGKGCWRLWPLLTVLAAGCDLPGRPDPADRPVPLDQVKNFDVLYATRCAGCHGADGKLGPAPPLNDPLFLAIVPDTELVRVISDGRAITSTQKSAMPAFRLGKTAPLTEAQLKVWTELKEETDANPRQQSALTAAQVKVLAEGIKKRWQADARPANVVPPYLAPKTAGGGNKDEGARVFARACAGCHGSQGQGGKYDNRQVGAINDPAFLALISDQALRRYAITGRPDLGMGRPDLGMPAFDGKAGRSPDFRPLNSSEIHDLVALLASWRPGSPANGK
jgi:mono/diheme cytochrome c family protein